MTEIKSDIKETVKAFIQTLVSIIVKEATKKMIKSLTEREKKKFESKIKDMSDDQLAQYLDKNLCFKNALENALKSLDYTHSAKGTVSLTDKLQSIFEETFTRKSINTFNWPVLHTIPAILVGILLLSTVTVSAVLLNSSDNNTSFINNTSFDSNTTIYPNNTILPVANFSSNVTSGSSSLTVQFSDLSENASEWNWDFGDGNNSAEQNPVHTYFAKGNYTVNLTVSDGNNTNSTNSTITVLEKPIPRGPSGPSRPSEELTPDPVLPVSPVANFSTNVTSGYAPLTVQFTDLSENTTGLNWNFGDGGGSTEHDPIHTYLKAGNYTVNLEAKNGNSTDSKKVPINAINIPEQPVLPVANFNANVTNGVAPLTVQFIDISTNATSWSWNFGNGQTSSVQNPINTYYSAGTYTVSLTASNDNGSNISTKSNLIIVNKIAPRVIWSNPADRIYGESIAEWNIIDEEVLVRGVLNAEFIGIDGNPLPGSHTYTPATGTVLNVGTHTLHVDFTPADTANYTNASKDVQINVLKATPLIYWNYPRDITYGEPLGDDQLNIFATESPTGVPVDGMYTYNPPAGTILSAGTHTLHVDFKPADAANYTNASENVQINVLPKTYAYVTNQDSNTVSIIDTSTNNVTATVNVGDGPVGVAVTPDGKNVYVTNNASNTVSVIDTATNTVIATLNVGNSPYGVAVSPDGTKVYVTNLHDNSVSVINTATNQVIATVPVENWPEGTAFTPDGKKVYVANYYSYSNISVIDTTTNTVVATVSDPNNIYGPSGIAIAPDGKKAYVTSNFNDKLVVIDTVSNQVVTTVDVESGPHGVSVSPDGTKVYVVNGEGNTISVIDTTTDKVIATVNVGNGPYGVAVSPDGKTAYVTNHQSNDVSIIDTATYTVIATVPVGVNPTSFGQFVGSIP